jgi:hypothetical protein
MSSVTRFIRQIPLATTYYNAAAVVASPSTLAFEFVPTAANYVGNYPPGYMQAASAALILAIQQAANAATVAGTQLVLRDMGKTIQAPVSNATNANEGFFRQVQLLNPSAISGVQGYIGGTAGNTFGVLGAANTPDAYTDYMTFYIPVTVAGILGVGVNTQAFALAGGQM